MIAFGSLAPAAAALALSFSAMRPEDVERVVEIERSSFPHPWSHEQFVEELRLPFSKTWLAWSTRGKPSTLVGYVCRWLTGDEMHILNVTVHPDWRCRGIGGRLLEQALDEARRGEARRALLEVRRQNGPARALYHRLGFRRVGVRPDYYGAGQDALLMELTL